MATEERTYNFSAGPATIPLQVLEQIQQELLNFNGCGASIMEISHRSAQFIEVLDSARAGVKQLLGIDDSHEVLFLQGGSRLQFSMIPMNLLRDENDRAAYIVSGTWSSKAFEEAKGTGNIDLAWTGKDSNFNTLPASTDLALADDPAFLYYASNETIHGVQFQEDFHIASTPLVCDASSDFLSRPINMEQHGIVYACAQKNAGPSGVTIIVIRKDLLTRSQASLPGYLNYKTHVEQNSMFNTPPTFGIYVVDLICKWLINEMGGLAQIADYNNDKATLLYDIIDQCDDMFIGHAEKQFRSKMNVTFNLPSEELTSQFLEQAAKQGLTSLKGHRSVGGVRASIYNAMPHEGVVALRDFMKSFYTQNS